MLSTAQRRGAVSFPEPRVERLYMVPFTQREGLPANLRRWQRTVDQMLEGVAADGQIYLMVDRGFVPAGSMLRRPGLHVDGHWMASMGEHRHYAPGRPRPRYAGHVGDDYVASLEGLILASDVTGCEAWQGPWSPQAQVSETGAVSDLDTSAMEHVLLEGGFAYAGNTAGMVHRSLPMPHDTFRSVVRLNVQGWEPPACRPAAPAQPHPGA